MVTLLSIDSILLSQSQPPELTLEKSVELALQQSYLIQNASQQYLSATKNYEAQSLVTATTIDLNLRAPDYSESLTNQFDPISQSYQYFQLQSTLMTGTLTINQPLVFTGGTLSLSSNFYKRNQLTGLSGSSSQIQDYYSNFQVGLQQPLFAPNVLKINKDQAFLRLDEATSNFKRTELDIIYQVTDAFYTAFRLSQQEEISAEQVSQNEESYQTAKSKYSAGLIPEVEYLQSDVDLVTSRNQRLTDQQAATSAKNTLKLLLGLPLDRDITLKADLRYDSISIDSNTAIKKALENRSELLNAQRDREISRLNVDLAASSRLVRLDLTAGYGLNRNDTQLESVFNNLDRSRSIALQLSVPIFDWGRHGREVEAAEAQLKSSELTYMYTEAQIRQEITDLLSRISVAQSRINVLARSVDVAQKSYEISIERFRVGTITRNDLAQSQARLTTTKLNNLMALIDFRMAIADLTRKTLWNFEKNQPVEAVLPTVH